VRRTGILRLSAAVASPRPRVLGPVRARNVTDEGNRSPAIEREARLIMAGSRQSEGRHGSNLGTFALVAVSIGGCSSDRRADDGVAGGSGAPGVAGSGITGASGAAGAAGRRAALARPPPAAEQPVMQVRTVQVPVVHPGPAAHPAPPAHPGPAAQVPAALAQAAPALGTIQDLRRPVRSCSAKTSG